MTPSIPTPAGLPEAGPIRYAVGEPLGRGGMADVFRADERDLDRPVAVKVMQSGHDPALFLREARVTAQLEHPNIPPVHDIGLTDDGRPFFTMKVVVGRTLKDAGLRLDVLMKVCDAVAFAHSRGVVHRDLKPANIMVGEFGEVLVMDWGLAKIAGHPDEEFGGTPAYMSPEQARGEPVDERADVFALRAVLYEMLAGRPPYSGATVDEVLEKASAGVFEPPPGPPELVAMTLKPYATVREFQDDLRRYLEGREVSARRDPLSTRLLKWARRNPVAVAAIAAALVAPAVGLGLLRARAAASEREHALAADALLATVPAVTNDRDERRRAIEALVAAADHLRRADDPPRLYDVNRRLGDWAMAAGDYALARTAFAACRAADPDRAAGLDALVAAAEVAESNRRADRIREALDDIASGFKDAGPGAPLIDDYRYEIAGFRDEQTVRLLADELEPFRERAARDGRAVAWSAAERGLMEFCFEILGRIEQPAAVEPLARMMAVVWDPRLAAACGIALCNTREGAAGNALLAARKRLHHNSDAWRQIALFSARVPDPPNAVEPRTAAEFVQRGLWRWEQRDADAAIEDYTRAIALAPESAAAYVNRAIVRHATGDAGGAIRDCTRAIDLDPNQEHAYTNRGLARQSQGDREGAIGDFTRAVELNASDPHALAHRGYAFWVNGQFDAAIADFTRAIDLDPTLSSAFNNRGLARRDSGDFDGALDDFARAIELSPLGTSAHANRGLLRWGKGDLDGALTDLTRAIELNPKDATAANNRGILHLNRLQIDEAIDDFTRAIALDPNAAAPINNRGQARAKKRDFEGAIEDYTRTLELEPGHPGALVNRGIARHHLGDIAGALADWERFLELAPDDPNAEEVRGWIEAVRKGP